MKQEMKWIGLSESRLLAYSKTKTQISCAVSATYIVQAIYFLNPHFQASSNLLWLYTDLVENPEDRFCCDVDQVMASRIVLIMQLRELVMLSFCF